VTKPRRAAPPPVGRLAPPIESMDAEAGVVGADQLPVGDASHCP